MCALPEVKPENYAAAKACLQKYVSLQGGALHSLSIQEDQNGKREWVTRLRSVSRLPDPTMRDFKRIRTVLIQNLPERAILRTITVVVEYKETPMWLWEVKYTVKKISGISKTINTLKEALASATPTMEHTAKTTSVIRQLKELKTLDKTKNVSRYFYELRQRRKTARQQNKTGPHSRSPVTASVPRGQHLADPPKKQEVQSDTATKPKSTYNAVPFDYHEMGKKRKLYSFKTLSLDTLIAMRTVTICDCRRAGYTNTGSSGYAWAVSHLKQHCEDIAADDFPGIYQQALERTRLTDKFVSAYKIKASLEDKYEAVSFLKAEDHVLCH